MKKKLNKYNNGGTLTVLSKDEEPIFQEWKKSLPTNLQTDNDLYDLRGAWKGGLEPELIDGEWHLGSRNPETGQLLKSPNHPTYDKMIKGEIEAGYTPSIDVKTGKMKSFGNGGELQGQQIGSTLGALSNLAIPGLGAVLSPLLGQIGSQIGAKIDMTKVLQDHYKSMSNSTNPYGNYENGGTISGLEGLVKYDGASHAQGGIQVNAQGIPSSNGVAEVEGDEVTMRSGNKTFVFSSKLKI